MTPVICEHMFYFYLVNGRNLRHASWGKVQKELGLGKSKF